MKETPKHLTATPPLGFEIEARNLTYKIIHTSPSLPGRDPTVRVRHVLDNVSVRARPFEVLAVVGPSGAGKSTLLQILTARLPLPATTPPAIYLNSSPLLRHSSLLTLTAFVPQHDALLPHLTVRETLLYTARLRGAPLPRVDSLLADLGLTHVAGVRVASLSGGERRRVSIAVEVVHDPGVVVLDEPTSGLDSSSAAMIVGMLRAMAEGRGRTVVVSIHQPGFRIVKMLAAVAVMVEGRVVHVGSVEELETRLRRVGREVPQHVNVVEYAVECVEELGKVREDERACRVENVKEKIGRCTLGDLFGGKKVMVVEEEEVAVVKAVVGGGGCGSRNWWVVETAILTRRYLKSVFRTKELFLHRTIHMLVSGLILGSVFYRIPPGLTGAKDRVGLFAFLLTFLLSSTTEALPVFLQERQILMKETSSGTYRLSAYTASNALVFLPFLLVLALLFSVPLYWLAGLDPSLPSFSYFTLLIWLVLYTANSVVVCFASIAPDFIVGNAVINGVLGAFFLFSGYFIRKEEMPSYWVFMHYLSLFKYPFEGFLVNELRDKCLEEKGGVCLWRGGDVLRGVGLSEESRWRNVGVMVGLIVLYRLLGYVFLRCRCRCVRKGGLMRALGASK